MRLLNLLRRYKKAVFKPQDSLLEIRINGRQLNENIDRFRELFPRYQLAAVLKSNAYGHGLGEIGKFLDKKKEINYLAVDSLIEAITLRDNGIRKPIMILGYVSKKNITQLKDVKNSVLLVNSLDQAQFLSKTVDFPLTVHLKVDTGMNRQGVVMEDLYDAIDSLLKNKKIVVSGLASHLADADSYQGEKTSEQIRTWKTAVAVFKKFELKGSFHFSATAGVKFLNSAESNLIRAGIGIYGFDTTQDKCLKVKPVLSFWAKLVNIKKVKAGDAVGYNFTWTAKKDTWLGVLPCGYYEGIPGALSNQGYVYWKETPLKIVGRVSMNLTTVDITPVKDEIKIENRLEVFSDDAEKLNSVSNVAKACGTIPYEILVRLAPTIRRVVD